MFVDDIKFCHSYSKFPYTARALVTYSIRARSLRRNQPHWWEAHTRYQNHKLSHTFSPSPLKPEAARHSSLFRVFFHLRVFQRLLRRSEPIILLHWRTKTLIPSAPCENSPLPKVRRSPLVEGKGHDLGSTSPGRKRLKAPLGPWAIWECFSTPEPALCHYRGQNTYSVFIKMWSCVLLFKLWASSKQTLQLIYCPSALF